MGASSGAQTRKRQRFWSKYSAPTLLGFSSATNFLNYPKKLGHPLVCIGACREPMQRRTDVSAKSYPYWSKKLRTAVVTSKAVKNAVHGTAPAPLPPRPYYPCRYPRNPLHRC